MLLWLQQQHELQAAHPGHISTHCTCNSWHYEVLPLMLGPHPCSWPLCQPFMAHIHVPDAHENHTSTLCPLGPQLSLTGPPCLVYSLGQIGRAPWA